MSKAWDLAIRAKQRSLAEYIFEKLESFWTPEEMAAHAEELQQLAFDKLEEYGFDRDLVEDVADMVSQDLLDATDDVLCRFEDDIDHRTRLSSKKSVLVPRRTKRTLLLQVMFLHRAISAQNQSGIVAIRVNISILPLIQTKQTRRLLLPHQREKATHLLRATTLRVVPLMG